MNWRALWLTLALAVAAPAPPPAEACGSDVETVAQTTTHPDLPLSRYAHGRLGLVRATFKVPYLVVAYRLMTPLGLSDAERTSAAAALQGRMDWSGPRPPVPVDWCGARGEVREEACPGITPTRTRDWAAIVNCSADAFVHAAATLRQRVADHGAESAEVRHFIDGQDVVFAACGASSAVPPPLPPSASAVAIADRRYHRGAAQMYAWQHDEAIATFRGIAADAASPWRELASYLVARVLVRKASLGPAGDSVATYEQALTELAPILEDARLAALHPAARRLQDRARFHGQPHAQLRRLAVALASSPLDDDFGRMLIDYAKLYGPSAPPQERDRLTTFIQVLQSGDYPRARRLYDSTRATVWLAAALMLAPPSADTEALREAALRIDPADPAAPTLLYHRARLLSDLEERYAAVNDALARLPKDLGPSTHVAFAELGMHAAATPGELVPHLVAKAAADYWDGIPEAAYAPPGLHPAAAHLLSSLPLDVVAEVARHADLPEPTRARLAAATWVRAELLDREDVSDALAPAVARLNPALAPDVEAVRVAPDNGRRRLALVIAMLRKPSLSPFVRAWQGGPVAAEAIASSYGAYWWCGRPAELGETRMVGAAGRARASSEAARFDGSGSDWIAQEVVRLSKVLPEDPRVAEALHLAVQGTRYGCRTGDTTARSARAFRRLQGAYGESEWAERTPYYY